MADDVYTYYAEDGGVEVREGPLDGRGRIWVPGRFQPPDYASPVAARVGAAGIKVWMASQWLDMSAGNELELRRRYGDALSHDDIEAVRWYREQHRDEIDERIRDESRAVSG